MATITEWNPFGVAIDLSASGSNIKRTSATAFTVDIAVSWKVTWDNNNTLCGMIVSSGGKTIYMPEYTGKATASGSGSFTGSYSISGNGAQTKTITVTFTNYDEDWQGNVNNSASKSLTFDVSVPAWTSYTVSYNANGGSGAPSSQTKWKDQALTLSSTKPTRTGYTFSKWNTKADGSGTSYNAGASYTANSGTTLYAIWTEHKLTVNYYSNYATYASYQGKETSVSANTNVLVHSQDFYYDNAASSGLADVQNKDYLYIFRLGYTSTKYWMTTTSGGTLISQSKTFSTGQALAQALGKDLSNGNASINLYPQWQINTYTFDYNANGGTGSMSSKTVNWNSNFVMPDNTFKREGYKFVGWNAYRNSDNTWYALGQTWLTEDEIINNGYQKKLYPSQEEFTFNSSWIMGNEDVISKYTMYAVWEISGVLYIDNGISFEPYLAYIDNGTDWDLYLMYVDDGASWNIIS